MYGKGFHCFCISKNWIYCNKTEMIYRKQYVLIAVQFGWLKGSCLEREIKRAAVAAPFILGSVDKGLPHAGNLPG